MSDLEIIKFSATWCRPCSRYAPIFDEFIEETGLKATSVDIDAQPELAHKYGVMSVPTTVYIKDGEVVGTQTGALSKPALRKMAESVS